MDILHLDMEVVELQPAERVTWRVVDGAAEWIGTTVDWRLNQVDGWTAEVAARDRRGLAAPRDLRISDWH